MLVVRTAVEKAWGAGLLQLVEGRSYQAVEPQKGSLEHLLWLWRSGQTTLRQLLRLSETLPPEAVKAPLPATTCGPLVVKKEAPSLEPRARSPDRSLRRRRQRSTSTSSSRTDSSRSSSASASRRRRRRRLRARQSPSHGDGANAVASDNSPRFKAGSPETMVRLGSRLWGNAYLCEPFLHSLQAPDLQLYMSTFVRPCPWARTLPEILEALEARSALLGACAVGIDAQIVPGVQSCDAPPPREIDAGC